MLCSRCPCCPQYQRRYRPHRRMPPLISRAGTQGTPGTRADASPPHPSRLGAERSLVQIQSPRLDGARLGRLKLGPRRVAGPRRPRACHPDQGALLAHRGCVRPLRRPSRRGPAWARQCRSPDGSSRQAQIARSDRSPPSTVPGGRLPEPLPRIEHRAGHVYAPSEGLWRGRHHGPRISSIIEVTSRASSTYAGSCISARASAASPPRRRSRSAVSAMARRAASARVMPRRRAISSSARKPSVPRRNESGCGTAGTGSV